MAALSEHLTLLSDSTRVRTLHLLEHEELSVGELASVLQLPQSTVSRHVKTLLGAGWLTKRAEGTASLLSVAEEAPNGGARELWGLVREAQEHQATFAEDVARMTSILEQRRIDSRAFFGRVAERWGQVRRELFGDQFTLATLLALAPRDLVVADLGCGPGDVAAALAPHVAEVVAVDLNERMLATSRARLANVHNASVVDADLTALPLDDDRVDASLFMLVLHTMKEPGAALAEAARITRPGGQVVVLDMQQHSRESYRRKMGHEHLGFSREQLNGLAEAAELTIDRYRQLPADEAAQGPPLFVAILRPKP